MVKGVSLRILETAHITHSRNRHLYLNLWTYYTEHIFVCIPPFAKGGSFILNLKIVIEKCKQYNAPLNKTLTFL